MNRMPIVIALVTVASSGCATGVGCAAGAVTGAGVATLASLRQEVGTVTVGYMATGAVFGAITGCVAGLFAGNRATTIERERAAHATEPASPAPKPAPQQNGELP